MFGMSSEDNVFAIALTGGIIGLLGLISLPSFLEGYKKQRELEQMKGMPDSYWEAKKEEAIASVKIHELDIQYKERMKLDEREREAKEREARRAFEQTAPAEYWESVARKAEAEERGRTERENAKAQANAITEAARQIRYAVG